MVIAILPMIDNVLCAGFIQTFQIIADTATLWIPGAGPAATAARATVEVVKTLANNDLGSEAFGNMITKTCGIEGDFKYWSIYDTLFDTLLAAPDSMGVSIGCVKKKGCKPSTPKSDPPADKPKALPDTVSQPQPPKTQNTPPLTDQAPPTTADKVPISTAEAILSTPSNSENLPKSTLDSLPSKSQDMTRSNAQTVSPSPENVLASTGQSLPSTSQNAPPTTAQSATTQSQDQPSTTMNSEEPSETDDDSATTTDETYETESDNDSTVSTISSTVSACQLAKRAKTPKNGKKIATLGNNEESQDCNNGVVTSHTTITSTPIGWYTSIYPMTCSKEYTQACYHYR